MDSVPEQLFEDPDQSTEDGKETESSEMMQIEPIGESPYEIFAEEATEKPEEEIPAPAAELETAIETSPETHAESTTEAVTSLEVEKESEEAAEQEDAVEEVFSGKNTFLGELLGDEEEEMHNIVVAEAAVEEPSIPSVEETVENTTITTVVTTETNTVTGTTITIEPSTVIMEPSTVTMEPRIVTIEPSTVTMEPRIVTIEPSTVTIEPSTVITEPRIVTIEPSTVTMEPRIVIMEAEVQEPTLEEVPLTETSEEEASQTDADSTAEQTEITAHIEEEMIISTVDEAGAIETNVEETVAIETNVDETVVDEIPGEEVDQVAEHEDQIMEQQDEMEDEEPMSDIVTMMSTDQPRTDERHHHVRAGHHEEEEEEGDLERHTQHVGRQQVFAEIIEEEIIEEETVEVRGDSTISSVKIPAPHHQSEDFITSLNPPEQQPHPRRLQAREDAAKRQDENVLISTNQMLHKTDALLRDSRSLLKSTQSSSDVYKGGDEPRKEQRERGERDNQDARNLQKEKRNNYKKKKARVDYKEKEVDPDYDPEDDVNDKAFLSPKDLEAAAFASRLPSDRMTKQEAISFPDIACANKDVHKHFLYIRNRLLFVWLEDPRVKLTVENATPRIEPPHNEDKELIERVYEYLYRYGFVNFGVYSSPEPVVQLPDAPKIVIVGAGVSGLTAARQLHEFGLDVEVIEARPVVGGRVCTFRDGPHIADLGAKVVTGLGGNPLAVLAKQLSLDLMPIKQDCPLYEFTGQMVPKERDERVEREFNRLLEATTYMSHQLNVNSINGRPVSLGQALEIIIKLQIRQVKEKQIKHGRERCEIQDKLNHIQQALFPLHEKIKDSHSKYLELKMKHEELSDQLGEVIRDQKAEFEVKQAYKVMLDTFSEYDSLLKEQQELEVKLTKMEQMVPNEIYMTPQERHVLDWHCANLEFANAAPLSALSLKHWDQDDDFEFTGNHLIVRDGMSTIPDAMKEGLNIKFNTACVGVKYTDSGVELATREVNEHNNSWATNNTQTMKCDAVLLTIPLGVLKKEKVKFEPPLPEWKTSAIKRMGFGNLNKVVLCFNKVFWDPSIHLFGHVSNSTISRGELFLFWSISKAPVLIALIAGEAATVIETVPDEAIVGRAMTILRAIFGFQTVPQPNKHRVTRWRGDAWALGSYSYVAAGSSGNDYDDLARPVAPPNSGGGLPKVFFAGEHTIRNYPATVHGALLSGLREGGRITDQFLGPPYANKTPVAAAAVAADS